MSGIDFNDAKIDEFRMYGGANGNKIGIIYQGDTYMLKYPAKAKLNPDLSYANSGVSEYVSCHIFETLGLNVQDTLLGERGGKIVVACKDFTDKGLELRDFAHLKNTIIDSEQNGYGTELDDILTTIHEQRLINPERLEDHFWQMFVADALLGNFDRHNGNWGFLIDRRGAETAADIAPIFDCGSCLYPQISENDMLAIMMNRDEINKRIYAYPTSAIKHDDVKIKYAMFLMSTDNEACIRALKTIGSCIDMAKINAIIDATPYISDTHKEFLSTMVRERKEHIIDKAIDRFIEPDKAPQKMTDDIEHTKKKISVHKQLADGTATAE